MARNTRQPAPTMANMTGADKNTSTVKSTPGRYQASHQGCGEGRAAPIRPANPAVAAPVSNAIAENETLAEARLKREEMMEQTRRDIEAETRRAIQEIRAEVADLTVMATEKVTRKSLDADDQRRLVEEALCELDFSQLSGDWNN